MLSRFCVFYEIAGAVALQLRQVQEHLRTLVGFLSSAGVADPEPPRRGIEHRDELSALRISRFQEPVDNNIVGQQVSWTKEKRMPTRWTVEKLIEDCFVAVRAREGRHEAPQ